MRAFINSCFSRRVFAATGGIRFGTAPFSMAVETRASAAAAAKADGDAATSKAGTRAGLANLAFLFVAWYAFNAYYNISNKNIVKAWSCPYTCAFLQVRP